MGATPPLLQCTVAQGGHCNPSYRYQWQSSPDHIQWTDMEGATSQNLESFGAVQKAVYYRRKVTEINSGTIGYSTTATILINYPPSPENSTNPAK